MGRREKHVKRKGRHGAFRPASKNGGSSVASGKGVFYDLLTKQPPPTPQQLRDRRIALIKAIQEKRGRPLIIYATSSNVTERRIPAYMHREDLIPLSETLRTVSGDAKAIDVLVETPGGLAEVAIEIVNLLRPRFEHVGFIVPHIAMSAGTILVMSGDEILMDHRSSLGPIDPQFMDGEGRPSPAQAIISGIETIKQEVAKNNGQLHPVYIPILRNIDPGRLQSAQNASDLSIRLVSDWLVRYKFRDWNEHSTTKQPVTPEDRVKRAEGIAKELCNHQKWLSHGHPVKIPELEAMKIKITDYGTTPNLQELIWELWVNLNHSFSGTNYYKLYESETIDLARIALAQAAAPAGPDAGKVLVDVKCQKCGTARKLQADFGAPQPLELGAEKFPKTSMITCRGCGTVINLTGLKLQLESQVKKPLII
jgi:serine dehydrogenase proteinase